MQTLKLVLMNPTKSFYFKPKNLFHASKGIKASEYADIHQLPLETGADPSLDTWQPKYFITAENDRLHLILLALQVEYSLYWQRTESTA